MALRIKRKRTPVGLAIILLLSVPSIEYVFLSGSPLQGLLLQFRDGTSYRDVNGKSEISTSYSYFELAEDVEGVAEHIQFDSDTSYTHSTVVATETSWFHPTKNCTETCCVSTVAISVEHERDRLLNTLDEQDLSDIMILYYSNTIDDTRFIYHGRIFHEDLLPCIQPGTIFAVQNYPKILEYFWQKIRPAIHVPFVVLNTNTDYNSPLSEFQKHLEDPLLLRWHGMNPWLRRENVRSDQVFSQFQPMPLGLDIYRPQSKYLTSYLNVTNFTNPFSNLYRFLDHPLDWERDVFLFFSRNRPHRERLWNILCENRTIPSNEWNISCYNQTVSPPSRVYSAMSHYLFSLSPPGYGWDCYRTYESWYLGLIPIVDDRQDDASKHLLDGLPVIQVPNLWEPNDSIQQDIMQAIQDFLQSPTFLMSDFEAGWRRLFLWHWRKKIVQDAGRPILTDETGKEYYVGYRYEANSTTKIFCSNEGSCE